MTDEPTDRLAAGHRRSLALLADHGAVRSTLDRYRRAVGVDVYLRLTADGLTVMSLDVEGCRSMISVGRRGKRDDVLRSLPPSERLVEAAAAGYADKRDGLGRGSEEERFALGQIAHALSNGLRLGESGWLFLHQEWRLRLATGPGKIDLLAFDPLHRRLVVIECKATEAHAGRPDPHGWIASRQADEYAESIWGGRAELYPFFSELVRSMAAVYAPDDGLETFELDLGVRPTTAVWWPGWTPAWPSWDSAELRVASDSARVAGYRAHQSRFRQMQLKVGPGPRPGRPDALVGSALSPADVEQTPSLNFVDAAAHRHAVERGVAVQAEGGTLEADRLFHNLLSSMPMCFNMFGALRAVPGFVGLVRRMFDPDVERVTDVICEDRPTRSLRDRTAFDAIVHCEDGSGARRFLAIETKYTEPFSATVYDTATYREVTERCGWFRPGAAEALVASATNQLWRGLMLAALVENETGSVGRYLVVAPADDAAAATAATSVAAELLDPDRLRLVTLEDIVAAASSMDDGQLQAWASVFGRRYLLAAQ